MALQGIDSTKAADKTKGKNAAVKAPAPAATTTILLTMAVYKGAPKRWVYQNVLYETGAVYEFPLEAGQRMLRKVTESGVPVFLRWEPPVKKDVQVVEIQQGPRVIQMDAPKEDVADRGLEGTPGEPTAPRRIDVGTDAELAEAGIETGDLSSSDIAGAVKL